MILLDYLETRSDVDASRIGMTGLSLGGMHTWLAAALDDRVAVAAPMIGVQVSSSNVPATAHLLLCHTQDLPAAHIAIDLIHLDESDSILYISA